MFGYSKTELLMLLWLGVFFGLLFAVWSRSQSAQRRELEHIAVTLENITADLDPEHITLEDLNRLLGAPGQYNATESPEGASKFTWGGVVEATFSGQIDAVTGNSTPVLLAIYDQKFRGSVRGVRVGFTVDDLYRVAESSGAEPEFRGHGFSLQVVPSWEISGGFEQGRVVSSLKARRLPDVN
jgi:hypothetical protein